MAETCFVGTQIDADWLGLEEEQGWNWKERRAPRSTRMKEGLTTATILGQGAATEHNITFQNYSLYLPCSQLFCDRFRASPVALPCIHIEFHVKSKSSSLWKRA